MSGEFQRFIHACVMDCVEARPAEIQPECTCGAHDDCETPDACRHHYPDCPKASNS